ncbi:30S ribosomal protein S14 [Porphyridium purpureum]|uniref:30S ribosomal protein S14 n=1 Tax=Porphyridium purpureum TaxID=35688 RepID=A0A5J4YQ48_PORPP|nr:30S ribosomal protein S14 [Porphyridium purpureum]|eukprot:POR0961..scf222_8
MLRSLAQRLAWVARCGENWKVNMRGAGYVPNPVGMAWSLDGSRVGAPGVRHASGAVGKKRGEDGESADRVHPTDLLPMGGLRPVATPQAHYLRVDFMDLKKRKMFRDHEMKRKVLNSIVHNRSLPLLVRAEATKRLAAMPHNSCFSRVKMTCIMSGRKRAVYKNLGVSRIVLREYVNKGLLPGIRSRKSV